MRIVEYRYECDGCDSNAGIKMARFDVNMGEDGSASFHLCKTCLCRAVSLLNEELGIKYDEPV